MSTHLAKQIRQLVLSAGLVGLLTSCTVGPNFHTPKAPAVQRYTAAKQPKQTVSTAGSRNAGKVQQFNSRQQIAYDCWRVFHSKQLDSLVKQGLAHSPTLAAAKLTLASAQESLKAQMGYLLLPGVDLDMSAQRLRTSSLEFDGESQNSVFNLYNASAKVSYFLDLFGKQRRQIESLRADVAAKAYQEKAVYISLTANILTTAFAIASAEAQIKATEDLIKAEAKTLSIMHQQLKVGGVSKEDVLLQQTQLAQTQASLPPLKQALSQATHSLAVLLGKLPSQQVIPKLRLSQIQLPRNLPLSLPSALVRQRPDIQESQALWHKASADVGVATANLFPQVQLTAGYGWASGSTGDFFNPNNIIWNLGSGLLQPLFHGGALQSERQAVIDTYKVAANNYRQTVLQAFKNVSDVLRAIEYGAQAYQREFQANNAAHASFQLVERQFLVGGVSYLTVLNAQEKYQQTELGLVKATQARYADTVALFQALGGGWWNKPVPKPAKPKKRRK